MTRRSAPAGPQAPHRFPHLETLYGTLTPMDSGMQSRVYRTADGMKVVKVYRDHQGHHRVEADNMRRAGLGEWVVDALEADDFFQASLKLIRFVRDLDPSLSHHKAVEAAMEFVIEADGFPLGLWAARQTVLSILCGPGPSLLWS